ncbi:MAG: prenyltransferase [Candidatus Dormibacteraeota bacterium]|nr:prenyltransferase [Candidatus Dormibacteraeota bacterium]
MQLPELLVPTADPRLQATVDAIIADQQPDGSIPWFRGDKMDPWNHVEAAMALVVGDRRPEADRAFEWMARNQLEQGCWYAYYRDGKVSDDTLDTNVTAYVAVGAWLHFLVFEDPQFLAGYWPVIERALGFVLALQKPSGAVRWARNVRGRPTRKGLIAGSSSIHLSLRATARIARILGVDGTLYDDAASRLAAALRDRPDEFLDKSQWAMDWYYPVMCGALRGRAARDRIDQKWHTFVVPGRGVRCVRHRPWVTAAETCELAMALVSIGDRARARLLYEWAQHLRGDDAAYWMGTNFRVGAFWPPNRPTWSSAAVVLAADALAGGPVAQLFGKE